MAAQEQVEQIVSYIRQLRPAPFFQQVDGSQRGIGAVMGFLDDAKGPVTAGSIAEFMGVSTARVAALLKKMAAKGLIEKEHGAQDARVTMVRLSTQGLQTAQHMKADMYRRVAQVIDQVGMDKLLEFFAIGRQIAALAPRPEEEPELCLHCTEDF